MKPLNKNILPQKRDLLSSALNIANQKPIKCHKITKHQLFSPTGPSKYFQITTECDPKINKPKSKDEKGLIAPLSSRQRKSSIKSHTKRIQANFLHLRNDNISIDLDISKSFTKANYPPKGGVLPPAMLSHYRMASNNNSIIRNDHISNYLNYNLGDTKNFTHLDEIGLDKNDNHMQNKEYKKYDHNDNHTPSTNEMEIDLSKASINFDSLLIGAKLSLQNHNHNSKKTTTTNIFSNNSVYYLDTIEVSHHNNNILV